MTAVLVFNTLLMAFLTPLSKMAVLVYLALQTEQAAHSSQKWWVMGLLGAMLLFSFLWGADRLALGVCK